MENEWISNENVSLSIGQYVSQNLVNFQGTFTLVQIMFQAIGGRGEMYDIKFVDMAKIKIGIMANTILKEQWWQYS